MVASVGAGLVPALCSRLLFGAPTRDAPTVSVFCSLYSLGRTRRYRPYGVVLFWAPTRDAPTVSVLYTLGL